MTSEPPLTHWKQNLRSPHLVICCPLSQEQSSKSWFVIDQWSSCGFVRLILMWPWYFIERTKCPGKYLNRFLASVHTQIHSSTLLGREPGKRKVEQRSKRSSRYQNGSESTYHKMIECSWRMSRNVCQPVLVFGYRFSVILICKMPSLNCIQLIQYYWTFIHLWFGHDTIRNVGQGITRYLT